MADVVQSLGIHHHSDICVLTQGMCAKDGVARLNDRRQHLWTSPH